VEPNVIGIRHLREKAQLDLFEESPTIALRGECRDTDEIKVVHTSRLIEIYHARELDILQYHGKGKKQRVQAKLLLFMCTYESSCPQSTSRLFDAAIGKPKIM